MYRGPGKLGPNALLWMWRTAHSLFRFSAHYCRSRHMILSSRRCSRAMGYRRCVGLTCKWCDGRIPAVDVLAAKQASRARCPMFQEGRELFGCLFSMIDCAQPAGNPGYCDDLLYQTVRQAHPGFVGRPNVLCGPPVCPFLLICASETVRRSHLRSGTGIRCSTAGKNPPGLLLLSYS